MTSLRGLWIFSPAGEILLSRRFVTVEQRVRVACAAHEALLAAGEESDAVPRLTYSQIAMPADDAVADMFRSQILLNPKLQVAVDAPVYRLVDGRGAELWPVTVTRNGSVFLMAVPAVDGPPPPRRTMLRPRPVQLPCVTATYCLLRDVADIVGTAPSDAALAGIQAKLSTVMPFGTPIESNADVVKSLLSKPLKAKEPFPRKRPAWLPHVADGRETVEISVAEEVRAVLYGRDDVPDAFSVQGRIHVAARLRGVPEVTIPLSHAHRVRDLRVHECCQLPDSGRPAALVCCPPLAPFSLCRYAVDVGAVDELPVTGCYTLRALSASRVRLELSLARSPHGPARRIERCAVHLPLPHRGAAHAHALEATTGKVRVVPDTPAAGALVIWEPGRAFCERGERATLRGTVDFGPAPPAYPHAPERVEPARAAAVGWEEHIGFTRDGEFSLRAEAKRPRERAGSALPSGAEHAWALRGAASAEDLAPLRVAFREPAALDVVGAWPPQETAAEDEEDGGRSARTPRARGPPGPPGGPSKAYAAAAGVTAATIIATEEAPAHGSVEATPQPRTVPGPEAGTLLSMVTRPMGSGDEAPEAGGERGPATPPHGGGIASAAPPPAGPASERGAAAGPDLGMDVSVAPATAARWLRLHPSKLMAPRTPAEDPFLVEGNAFARVHFQVMDATVSGLAVNADAVAVHPATSAKVSIVKGVTTADFVLWNSLGAVKFAAPAAEVAAPAIGPERDSAIAFATAAANAEAAPFVHTMAVLPRDMHERLASAPADVGDGRASAAADSLHTGLAGTSARSPPGSSDGGDGGSTENEIPGQWWHGSPFGGAASLAGPRTTLAREHSPAGPSLDDILVAPAPSDPDPGVREEGVAGEGSEEENVAEV